MIVEFEESEDYKRIFSFHDSIQNRLTSRESSCLEFKESFNWNSKDRYVKSMVAFANNRGGHLVFGVKDKPRDIVGLSNDNFEALDESRISTYLSSVFAPEISFEKLVITVNSKKIGIICVYESENKPIICSKNDGILKEGDIYYRYNGSSGRIKYPELKTLHDSILEKERRCWMKHFEKISKIGSENAVIMDTLNGEISGHGGTVIIDEKLLEKIRFINQGTFQEGGKPVLRLVGDVTPVSISVKKDKHEDRKIRIVDDSTALACKIDEDRLIKGWFTYKGLLKELKDRYIDFKQDQNFHKLRRTLMKDKKLCITRYLDPGRVESGQKDFYSPEILNEFDKNYTKKPK